VKAVRACGAVRSDYESANSKSQLAAQLAWSLAERGDARVLLVEADFDEPNVHRLFSLQTPAFQGFSQQLYRRLTTGERTPWYVARCGRLSVLAEGRVRTPGFSASLQFASALAELRGYYDLILIDGPPEPLLATARTRGGVADGVVFAATEGSEAAHATEPLLDHSPRWLVHIRPTGAKHHA
jgi:polysaccharide biosynthesis transport protein